MHHLDLRELSQKSTISNIHTKTYCETGAILAIEDELLTEQQVPSFSAVDKAEVGGQQKEQAILKSKISSKTTVQDRQQPGREAGWSWPQGSGLGLVAKQGLVLISTHWGSHCESVATAAAGAGRPPDGPQFQQCFCQGGRCHLGIGAI